ncbi:acyltransferase [Aquitalea sp. USM4]|uniref:acyltransferase family protein n=1 Tax=Aquitalea sp. USM4 TaxID=1590041 RepID=UPI00103F62EC|nr:acyltransferase [Aquitalea sp. USM4]QBJ79409.1 acyltransferase [Aquitalea sp. USM4]
MKRIVELDGLRGVLALWVVLYHMCSTLPAIKHILSGYFPIVMEAWFPVDVFFMMSGFVMMHVYGEQFASNVSVSRFKHFMVARFARLYPVHAFSLLCLLFIMLPGLIHEAGFYSLDGRYSIGTLGASFLLLQAPWVLIRTWNYPAWSISAEWHVYVLFPLLMMTINKLGKRTVIFSIVLLTAFVFLLYCSLIGNEKYPTNGLAVMLRVVPLFYSGMALYRLLSESNGLVQVHLFPAFLIAAFLFFLLSNGQLSTFAVFFVPVLIFLTLSNSAFSKVFGSKFSIFLGKISYSMYMTHAVVQALVLIALPNFLHRKYMFDLAAGSLFLQLLFFLVAVLLSVLIGWLVCVLLEAPMRRFVIEKLG